MSADEIRMLAESCKDKANYYKSMTPCSDLEHDKWYRDAAKRESDKAAALLAYAAMVERSEAEIALTDKTHYTYNRLTYILKGATNERK